VRGNAWQCQAPERLLFLLARHDGRKCVAVCCSVLQRVAVCCSAWQCQTPDASHSCLQTQQSAVSCSVLQCVAVCCSVLQCMAVSDARRLTLLPANTAISSELQCVAVCCSVMQCVAVCCSVLQCVAVHGSVRRPMPHTLACTPRRAEAQHTATLQHTATTHCNTATTHRNALLPAVSSRGRQQRRTQEQHTTKLQHTALTLCNTANPCNHTLQQHTATHSCLLSAAEAASHDARKRSSISKISSNVSVCPKSCFHTCGARSSSSDDCVWIAAPAVQYVQYAELFQKTCVNMSKETYIYEKKTYRDRARAMIACGLWHLRYSMCSMRIFVKRDLHTSKQTYLAGSSDDCVWIAAPALQYVQCAELFQKTCVNMSKKTYMYEKRHVEICMYEKRHFHIYV